MSARDPLWRRYHRFFRPDPAADADDELTFHLEELTAQFRAEGMDETTARRAAQARFGDVNEARRSINASLERKQRRTRRTEWWRRIGFDVRIALRKALRRPAFTLAAIATLALGIGANGAVFSVVNAALFRALPYPDAGNIVRLDEIVRGRPFSVSPANFVDFRGQTHAFDGMAAFNEGVSTLTGLGDPQPISSATVTADFFDVMRVRPALGRAFAPAEFVTGQDKVVMLSDALWRTTFGARANIAGQSIQLDGKTYLVIGVMPAGFAYPDGSRLWTPLALSSGAISAGQRGAHFLTVVARLKPGMSMEAASRDAASIAAMLASTYPATNKGNGAVLRTLRDDLVGPSLRRALLVLFGAVAMVALIAAVNVANLLLARGASQEREFAVRTALGARPRDLIGFAFV
ncbi:MAG: ABC transporter permease, partial [Gemmatimonadales bacterium]